MIGLGLSRSEKRLVKTQRSSLLSSCSRGMISDVLRFIFRFCDAMGWGVMLPSARAASWDHMISEMIILTSLCNTIGV